MCMSKGAPQKPAYGPCNETHGGGIQFPSGSQSIYTTSTGWTTTTGSATTTDFSTSGTWITADSSDTYVRFM